MNESGYWRTMTPSEPDAIANSGSDTLPTGVDTGFELEDPDIAGAFTSSTDYPLLVVTSAGADGERGGCLAGFASQCSIDPPRFLVCISRANRTFGIIHGARLLALHLLGEYQGEIASLFGEETGDAIDKFADLGWHPGPGGVPLLDDCAAWMVVEILRRIDVGDHEAQLTAPVKSGSGNRPGLLTFRNAPPLEAGHPAE